MHRHRYPIMLVTIFTIHPFIHTPFIQSEKLTINLCKNLSPEMPFHIMKDRERGRRSQKSFSVFSYQKEEKRKTKNIELTHSKYIRFIKL